MDDIDKLAYKAGFQIIDDDHSDRQVILAVVRTPEGELIRLDITDNLRAFAVSLAEGCAKECDDIDAQMLRSAESQFLTDAGRTAYTSASAGAASCARTIRAKFTGNVIDQMEKAIAELRAKGAMK